jgi:glycosyltransferase involved in cell wall biosynthesis
MRETDARPLVSVIIPVFNRTESLAGGISSVQAQTMSDWELIVVNDCSMYPLDAMIESLHDPRIRLLRHEANRGVSAARNTGLDAANGRLVAFLDSDDGWLPNKLLEQNRLIAGHSSPKNVICVTQTIVMRSKNDCVIFPISGPRPDQTIAEFLYAEDGGFAQVSSFCLALETARRVRFNEALNQYEDHLFLIEAMAAGVQYALVPEALSI